MGDNLWLEFSIYLQNITWNNLNKLNIHLNLPLKVRPILIMVRQILEVMFTVNPKLLLRVKGMRVVTGIY